MKLNGQRLMETDSNSDFNRLSGELNKRITQEMDDFMSTVSSQIPRAINEAISDQILSQIQATLRSGQGQMPDLKKPQSIDSEAIQEMSSLGSQKGTKT